MKPEGLKSTEAGSVHVSRLRAICRCGLPSLDDDDKAHRTDVEDEVAAGIDGKTVRTFQTVQRMQDGMRGMAASSTRSAMRQSGDCAAL